MWDHLPVRNLIGLQQIAAIKKIDEQIIEAWNDGCGVEVDRLLDRRSQLMDQVKRSRQQP